MIVSNRDHRIISCALVVKFLAGILCCLSNLSYAVRNSDLHSEQVIVCVAEKQQSEIFPVDDDTPHVFEALHLSKCHYHSASNSYDVGYYSETEGEPSFAFFLHDLSEQASLAQNISAVALDHQVGAIVTLFVLDDDTLAEGELDQQNFMLNIPEEVRAQAYLNEDKNIAYLQNIGTWMINRQDVLTFIPETDNFASTEIRLLRGDSTPIHVLLKYISYPPISNPDVVETSDFSKGIKINVLDNDYDQERDIQLTSVRFVVEGISFTSQEVSVNFNQKIVNFIGEGVWTVSNDGVVTFNPVPNLPMNFKGEIYYQVQDVLGNWSIPAKIKIQDTRTSVRGMKPIQQGEWKQTGHNNQSRAGSDSCPHDMLVDDDFHHVEMANAAYLPSSQQDFSEFVVIPNLSHVDNYSYDVSAGSN